MANSWSLSLSEGNKAEAVVARTVTQYGFNVQSYGPIGESNIPSTLAKDTTGKLIRATSPDLMISKIGWPNVALEVKRKAMSGGFYWIDERRLDYTDKWSRLTNNPVFWVIQPKHDTANLICASTRKLKDSHHSYNPNSTARDGSPEPTFLYEPDIFKPFTDLLEGNVKHEISYDMYVVDVNGEMELL